MDRLSTSTPQLEAHRLNTLSDYQILDTPPDDKLDRITLHAAITFNVPIALISLVDKDRIWFKSKYGLEISEIPRESSFCTWAIKSEEVFVIENGKTDPRMHDHPLIENNREHVFYAAAPLKVANGDIIGTLCIVDYRPRLFSALEKRLLQNLGQIAVDQIETTYSDRLMIKELLSIAAHELKHPLTTIPIWAKMIENESLELKTKQLARYIQRSSGRMVQLVNQLSESVHFSLLANKIETKPVNLSPVVTKVVMTNITLATEKNQKIYLEIEQELSILGNELKISEVVDNLVNNAIKYSKIGTEINVSLKGENGRAIIKVTDQGPGITEKDLSKIFLPFSKLSARPTAGESSTGLGLSIVKQIVEAHKGKIWCENNASGPGASFITAFPRLKISDAVSS